MTNASNDEVRIMRSICTLSLLGSTDESFVNQKSINSQHDADSI